MAYPSLCCVVSGPPDWELEYWKWEREYAIRHERPIPEEIRPPEATGLLPDLPFAPTTTEADEKNDLHSLDRSLNRSLVLMVKETDDKSGEERWVFPSVPYKALPFADVTPRDAVLQSMKPLGEELNVFTLSNAPIAYHRVEYDQEYKKITNTQQKGNKVSRCTPLLSLCSPATSGLLTSLCGGCVMSSCVVCSCSCSMACTSRGVWICRRPRLLPLTPTSRGCVVIS
jgi:hypothetical protein